MLRSTIWRLRSHFDIKNSVRSIVDAPDRLDVLKKHAYYQKTLTKDELIQHLKDNVVYDSDKYVVVNVPAGLPFKKNKTWIDTVSPLAAEVDFNDILEDLPGIFNTSTARLVRYPRRNASGVAIFAKSFEDSNKLVHRFTLAASMGTHVFTFLAVVLGRPPPTYSNVFGLKPVKVGDKYGTEVLLKFDSKKFKKTHYKHKVLDSSDLVSLVKVDVSNDNRDCVRHILASACLTPILGDHWSYKKRKASVLGVPLVLSPSVVSSDSVELEPELLEKLELQSGEEKLIPIHSHLLCVKVVLKNQKMLIVSAPPPECFVWTCSQFGFEQINNFLPSDRWR